MTRAFTLLPSLSNSTGLRIANATRLNRMWWKDYARGVAEGTGKGEGGWRFAHSSVALVAALCLLLLTLCFVLQADVHSTSIVPIAWPSHDAPLS